MSIYQCIGRNVILRFSYFHRRITPRLFLSDFLKEDKIDSKKKKPREIRINVMSKDRKMTVMAIEDAESLAKRRGLVLHKIENAPKYMTVGEREAFELRDPIQLLGRDSEDKYKSAGFKGLKQLRISCKIEAHDLHVKLKKVQKWLGSGLVAEIFIEHTNQDSNVQDIIHLLEAGLKDCAHIPGKIASKSKILTKIVYEPSLYSPKRGELQPGQERNHQS